MAIEQKKTLQFCTAPFILKFFKQVHNNNNSIIYILQGCESSLTIFCELGAFTQLLHARTLCPLPSLDPEPKLMLLCKA